MSPKAAQTCFVISPIGEPDSEVRKNADQVLKHIIQPVVEGLGYEAVRADSVSDPGLISKSILRHILEDELLVADLSGHNPNVFYELAVRHATGKPVVQIISAEDRIPFDVSDIRTIQYTLDLDGVDQAKAKLKSYIDSLEGGAKADTPISDVLRLLNIKTTEPPDSALAQVIEELQRIPEYLESLELRLVGRMAEQFTVASEPGTIQDRAAMMLFEKMFEDPAKARDVISMITRLPGVSAGSPRASVVQRRGAPKKRKS